MDVLKNTVGFMPTIPIDIPNWAWHLQRQFTLNEVQDDLKLPLLNQLLNDKARKLMARLPADVTRDYDALMKALMNEFQLTPVKYREAFLSIHKKFDETFSQLASRIEIHLKYYLDSREVAQTDENKSLFDLMISDKFKDCVPEEYQSFLRLKELDRWMTAHELGRMLDVYTADQGLLHSSRGRGGP
jgi:hypothetical protein